MNICIPTFMNNKSTDQMDGLVGVDSILFSEATASVSLGGLLGSTGGRSRDHYECLIIPVRSW